jgi:S1-C subfamily serine protease
MLCLSGHYVLLNFFWRKTMANSSVTASTLLALSNDLADAVARAGRAVVAVNARPRIPSSGVHWRQGLIVTAEHTVQRDEEITITLPDGQTAQAELVGRDSSTDLAVLRLSTTNLLVGEMGDAMELKIGHLALAVGRPGERGLSASLGVISALGGSWRTWGGSRIDQFIRLDLALYPGFSGGALVDGRGRVAGIVTSGPRNSVLAIPAATVNRVVDQLLEKGRITRGYLGLGMQPLRLPDALKQSLKLEGYGGVIIVAVEPGGPAEQAGALIGDVLVELDGRVVNEPGDVQAALDPEQVGKTIKAKIVRAGAKAELSIVVGERTTREE